MPATVIKNDLNFGIRYYGIPFGYEFAALRDDMIMLGAVLVTLHSLFI